MAKLNSEEVNVRSSVYTLKNPAFFTCGVEAGMLDRGGFDTWL